MNALLCSYDSCSKSFGETTPSGRPSKAHRSPNDLGQGPPKVAQSTLAGDTRHSLAGEHLYGVIDGSCSKSFWDLPPRRRPWKACLSQNDDFLPRFGIHPLQRGLQGTSIPKRFGTTISRAAGGSEWAWRGCRRGEGSVGEGQRVGRGEGRGAAGRWRGLSVRAWGEARGVARDKAVREGKGTGKGSRRRQQATPRWRGVVSAGEGGLPGRSRGGGCG